MKYTRRIPDWKLREMLRGKGVHVTDQEFERSLTMLNRDGKISGTGIGEAVQKVVDAENDRLERQEGPEL